MLPAGLLCAFFLLFSLSDAKQTFPKAEIISHVDVAAPQSSVPIERCNVKYCLIYVVATQVSGIETNIVITQHGDNVVRLNELVNGGQAPNGLIKSYNLTGGVGYKVENKNAAGTVLTPFFIYVVQSDADHLDSAVYDAIRTGTVTSTPKRFYSAVTILSVAPYFTLSGYTMSSLSSVFVYTAGYDSIKDTTRIFTTGDSTVAAKSLTTVAGPVATVYFPTISNKAHSFNVDLGDRRTAIVDPGAAFIAMSPGYSGNGANYPSALDKMVSYTFTLTQSAPVTMTISCNTKANAENVTISTTGDFNESHFFNFGGNAIKNDKENFNASSIVVSWNRTVVDSYFLINFVSAGDAVSTTPKGARSSTIPPTTTSSSMTQSPLTPLALLTAFFYLLARK